MYTNPLKRTAPSRKIPFFNGIAVENDYLISKGVA